MVKNKLILEIFYELIWFALAAVAAYLITLPIRNEISFPFYRYLICASFLSFTYFRFIAFMSRSIILENIWVKLLLFVFNVPFFFYLLNLYFNYGRSYDEYNFTLPATIFQNIKSGTELDDLMYIKNLVNFCGVASLMTLLLLEIRIVIAVFKLRQLDKYITKKPKKNEL